MLLEMQQVAVTQCHASCVGNLEINNCCCCIVLITTAFLFYVKDAVETPLPTSYVFSCWFQMFTGKIHCTIQVSHVVDPLHTAFLFICKA